MQSLFVFSRRISVTFEKNINEELPEITLIEPHREQDMWPKT